MEKSKQKQTKELKEFDIEKAKAGAPVCTRDGRPVRIICFDFQEYGMKEADEKYPIIALVKEDKGERAFVYRESGKCKIDKNDELVMAPVKREGWVLIHPVGPQCIAHIYDTREEAEEDAEREMIDYSAIAHIEWEE